MAAFKKTPAKVEKGKPFGMGKVSQKGHKLVVIPIKRKGVNVGKKNVIK